ncbi:MAG: chromosomal replication initiator protein DnaA [Candidatus Pacebacteria bacterium]|nr:chromosomal replication initiator protein DnaA [Candidatus Paceibacterota bacterium]
MTNEQLWQAVMGEVELSISKASFTTWFKDTSIISVDQEKIIVGVPSGFAEEWLKNKYHKFILKAFQKICPQIEKVTYKIVGNFKPPKNGALSDLKQETSSYKDFASNQEEELPDDDLNPRYTFDNFVVASNNELAHAACSAVSKNPGVVYNPLFIYGGVGLGKTHLLQSIGNELLRKDPKKKIKYASSEKFTNELISAIGGKNTKGFKDLYRKIDVLIIDDIQFLAGKEKTQEEFFYTFNALYEKNKQVVISSDRPPKAIPALEERLRSRFEGGMIADIGFPEYETRLAILIAKIKERNFEMPEESLNYIALHIQKNIRELEGALNTIMATCELKNDYPDLDRTKEILSQIISQPIKKATTPKDILKHTSSFYGVALDDLKSRSRKNEIVKPRQIAMYLMRSEIKSSFPSIGSWLGGRDHTTAMHAYDKISKEIENDKTIEQEIRLIIEKIYNA